MDILIAPVAMLVSLSIIPTLLQKTMQRANLFLVLAYFCMAGELLYLFESKHLQRFILMNTDHIFFYLLFPSVYLYMFQLLYPQQSCKIWIHYWLVLFPVVSFIYSLFKPGGISLHHSGTVENLIHMIGLLIFIFYYARSWLLIVRYRRIHSGSHGILEDHQMVWGRRFVLISLFMNIYLIFSSIYLPVALWLEYLLCGLFIFLSFTLFLFQIKSFKEWSEPERQEPQEPSSTKLRTDPEVQKETIDRFLELLSGERLYLKPKLSLKEVAAHLHTSEYQLSQSINCLLKKNFHHCINEYRVEHACSLLLQPESSRYTIECIALESGFASRERFFIAFKKITGLTPSQFRSKKDNSDKNFVMSHETSQS